VIRSHVVEHQQARPDVTGIRKKVNNLDPNDVCESSFAKMAAMRVNDMGFQPTGGLQRKITVYGLNGHRANFIRALSLGGYGHAI
jgi:hypothetical protein